jgi:ribosome assembly protein YihI (activator of Der GTPase)
MSRKKKSRTPGTASITLSKEDKLKALEPKEKRFKKSHGNPPGNRQQEATLNQNNNTGSAANKDPRIGNKTPIVLIKTPKAEKQQSQPKVKQKLTPIAAVHKIDSQQSYEDELYAIEAEPQLQEILQKQEDEVALTEPEIEYFNEKMDRHSTLREKLGWDDEDELDTDETNNEELDENTLWDKLDNNSFSDTE